MDLLGEKSHSQIKGLLSTLGKDDKVEKVVSSYRTIIQDEVIISLDLIGLGITDLPNGIFDNFLSLTQLYLSWNNIKRLHPLIFAKLVNLQHLDLRGSGLIEVDKSLFKELRSLQRLEMNDNNLMEIPKGLFDNLHAIREINLSNNKIAHLDPTIFDNLYSLEFLYLYFNPLPGEISFGNYYDRESVLEAIEELKRIVIDQDRNL